MFWEGGTQELQGQWHMGKGMRLILRSERLALRKLTCSWGEGVGPTGRGRPGSTLIYPGKSSHRKHS